MFQRVTFEEWQGIITIVAFFIFLLTFLFLAWRAIRMKREEREHLSNLPLETEESSPPQSHERSQKPH